MRRTGPTLLAILLAASALFACGEQTTTKESWKETGRSWGEGGRQFLRALGRSISGEGSPKQEWKKTGQEFKEAGKDTAQSLGETVDPDDGAAAPNEAESP